MGVLNFRIFSSLRMRADLNNFWWIWEPTRRTFKTKKLVCVCVFFWQKKKSEFTTEISFCEFGFFSAKKTHQFFSKVRHVGSRVHQKLSKSARVLSEEKYSVSCLVLLVRVLPIIGSATQQSEGQNRVSGTGRFQDDMERHHFRRDWARK